MAGGNAGDRPLTETPTWAVALVCALMVLLSVLLEHALHHLQKLFQRRQKKAMLEALEKIKAELMLLGFISLLLTVCQQPISKICVDPYVAHTMLPCLDAFLKEDDKKGGGDHKRRLLWDNGGLPWRRALAGGGSSHEDYCLKSGKVPLISQSGIHQLHIFIFVLAVFHVFYSFLTMRLAQAKVKRWKKWEEASIESQHSNDPTRLRYTRQTSFVRRHGGILSTPGIKYIAAFFRQFTGAVTKVDYLTMRYGFINAHLPPGTNFNFHKYIKNSMEDDFKLVVGISLPLWLLAVAMLLLNVYGWYSLYWISFLPLLILLVVDTKLVLVIMKLAHRIQDTTAVVVGAPLVQPSNEYFWFGHPEWILKLIHLTLFENAFQVAYFLWVWYSFGFKSCFNDDLVVTIIRVVVSLALQLLCSYITVPLYALVTQMGTHMKKKIFEEQTAKAFQKWRQLVVERKNLRDMGFEIPYGFDNNEATPRGPMSPVPLLPRHHADSVDIENAVPSAPIQTSEVISEMEADNIQEQGNSEQKRHEKRSSAGS